MNLKLYPPSIGIKYSLDYKKLNINNNYLINYPPKTKEKMKIIWKNMIKENDTIIILVDSTSKKNTEEFSDNLWEFLESD